MLSGASTNEILMVVFLVALIAVAPKVGRIGEIVGGLFERGGEDAGRDSEG